MARMIQHAADVDAHAAQVAALVGQSAPPTIEWVELAQALGRVTAESIAAQRELPAFRNAQMDGYAVNSTGLVCGEWPAPQDFPATDPLVLKAFGVIAAGPGASPQLSPGTAVRIMTGALMPEGADTVVPVEQVNSGENHVALRSWPGTGAFVRHPGDDVRVGDILVDAGATLAPRHLAALAAAGEDAVPVWQRPRVAIITTGDEVVPAGNELRPGEIHNSNAIALAAAAQADGAEVVSVAHSSDDPAQLRALLADATAAADVVLTSGGVSMGDFEVVKEALAPLGSHFTHLNMQPGGPQGAGMIDKTAVLSFPGNPVSALVSFAVFARGPLRAAAALAPVEPAMATLAEEAASVDGKRQFLRGALDGGVVRVVSGPGSHLVATMARADVLIDIPAHVTRVAQGELVRVWPL
jgi:molybdopterin molybdotransferase